MHVAGRNHKKAVVPVTTRKLWAKQLQAQYKVSISLSCLASGVSRSAFYYAQKCSDDTEVIDVLNQIVQTHQRWGFPKWYKRIRTLGHKWNHNRVYKIDTAVQHHWKTTARPHLQTK